MKKTYVAITEESGGEDGEFFYEVVHTFKAEDDPKEILFALKALGLTYELKNYATTRQFPRIIEISREWTGEELLKLAHLKLDEDYILVPEDTPEKPMKIIPLEPIMSVARSFKEEDPHE